MFETVNSLHATLPPVQGKVAPEWVQLTPAGTVRGEDGRGPYVIDPQAVAATSLVPFPIDENHSIDLALKTGGASPARGWVTALEARADGVYGRVDWTAAGSDLVTDRAYRSISPALATDKQTGRVLRIVRAALTNLPNLGGMTSLHHQETSGMELDTLRTELGLKADASFADCLAAIKGQRTAISTHATDLARLRKAAGAAETADVGAIETVLHTARDKGSEVTRMAAEIVSLQSKLGTIETQGKRDRAVQVIDRAIEAGKPVTALRDHYIERHMADPAAVEKELEAMISLHAGGIGHRRPAPSGTTAALTREEQDVARRMGVDPDSKAFKEAREKRAVGGGY